MRAPIAIAIKAGAAYAVVIGVLFVAAEIPARLIRRSS